MVLPELILTVLDKVVDAVGECARGAQRPAAESLTWVANKIMKELPEIKLPPEE